MLKRQRNRGEIYRGNRQEGMDTKPQEGSISGLCGSVSQGQEQEKEVMGSKSGK
ncbi:hypothetical protein QCA50_007552 [Cerrena zonata]|uniref:Uncharacterized protein n=1 Tax=Cerrena zonata TaxID=2478898 RepID=A0AAW0GFH0_9APHY